MEKLIIWLFVGVVLAVASQGLRATKNYNKCKQNGGKIFKKRRGKIFYEEICIINGEIIKGSIKVGKGEIIPEELLTKK